MSSDTNKQCLDTLQKSSILTLAYHNVFCDKGGNLPFFLHRLYKTALQVWPFMSLVLRILTEISVKNNTMMCCIV